MENYLLYVKPALRTENESVLKFIFLKLLMTFKEISSNLLLYYFETGIWNVVHLDLKHKRLKSRWLQQHVDIHK